MKKSHLVGAFSACVFSFAVTSAHAINYTITDLTPLIGTSSTVTDINNSGWLTGTSNGHAFIYDGTTMHDLGTLGGTSFGAALNNRGWVTGWSYTADGYQHAFLYDGSTMHDIGTFTSGGTTSSGTAINDSGWVTGSGNFVDPSIEDYGGGTHAFLYDGSTMQDLGDLGFPQSHGFDINNRGWVTGYSWLDEGRYHAFLYDGSTMHDIGALGWTTGGLGEDVDGNAINERGWITGTNWLGEPPPGHAFIYDGTTMHDLGTLYGLESSIGSDINNRGWVVGSSFNQSPPTNSTAFLYDGNTMLDLCVLTDCIANGWEELGASRINDRGDIIGTGLINGEWHTILMSEVPIPATVWLFGSGLLGLVGIARRNKMA